MGPSNRRTFRADASKSRFLSSLAGTAGVMVVELLPFIVVTLATASLARGAVQGAGSKAAIAIVACALAVGHVLNEPRLSYPLDSWRMYTTSNAPRVYYEFVIVSSDGASRYPFEIITPLSPGPLRHYSMLAPLSWRLIQMQRSCRCRRGEPTIDLLIAGMVNAYVAQHSVDLRSFEIYVSRSRLDGEASHRELLYGWYAR
jgi:hypothetical protein